MTPTSFQFLVSMPGDSRLVTVVRDLTAYVANYANLDGDAGQSFAQEVVDAMRTAISATGVQNAPIELKFNREPHLLRVTISWPTNGSTESRDVTHALAS